MIPTFDFNLDRVNLEIFPDNIWLDPNVVFHGTSEYHSQEIERNGFIPATAPFDINDARELVKVLQLPGLIQFDRPQEIGMTVSKTLDSYISGIANNDFRLSFAYLSYLCVFFTTGRSKGGQIFGNVRQAKLIIQQATQANSDVERMITEPIKRLFELETNVAKANGVVYAVKLESAFNGISEEYGNIHSKVAISAKNIIGKVILPNDINMNEFTITTVKRKNIQKLLKPGHLGINLYKMNLNDDDMI